MSATAPNDWLAGITFIAGAVGALTAIFLKEAVQAALQRRLIAWQLQGYLMAWKSNLLRQDVMASLYIEAGKRRDALSDAYRQGSAHFSKVHEEQRAERNVQRDRAKAAILNTFKAKEGGEPSHTLPLAYLNLAGEMLAEQRKLLADSKTFLSDRDGAHLGNYAASHVVQFRASLLTLASAIEAIPQAAKFEEHERSNAIAQFVDQIMVSGEDALVSFISLEATADRISRKSLASLVWDILTGR